MSDRRKLERWKKDILNSIDEVLDLDNLKDENLTALAMFRMLDLYYQDMGYRGIETIQRIWAFLEMQNQKKKEETGKTDSPGGSTKAN